MWWHESVCHDAGINQMIPTMQWIVSPESLPTINPCFLHISSNSKAVDTKTVAGTRWSVAEVDDPIAMWWQMRWTGAPTGPLVPPTGRGAREVASLGGRGSCSWWKKHFSALSGPGSCLAAHPPMESGWYQKLQACMVTHENQSQDKQVLTRLMSDLLNSPILQIRIMMSNCTQWAVCIKKTFELHAFLKVLDAVKRKQIFDNIVLLCVSSN